MMITSTLALAPTQHDALPDAKIDSADAASPTEAMRVRARGVRHRGVVVFLH
jgi:hypothetical protein